MTPLPAVAWARRQLSVPSVITNGTQAHIA
jgi:hypothetical protein